jgi:predicted house-cleaning NTP pyrophosphatase (Maf/HAM1 superfamily)
MDKAGAYGIQGDDGWLIERVVGSRANVMGLPIGEIAPVLLDMGVERSST